MAVDAFMELSGGEVKVEGETQDTTFKRPKAFEITSFSWGVGLSDPESDDDDDKKNNDGKAGSKKGSKLGRDRYQAIPTLEVELKPFTIKKPLDKASASLFFACCKKAGFSDATITFRKAGQEEPIVYLVLYFTELYVESFEIEMTPGESSGTASEETVGFLYGSCQIEYKPQLKEGRPVPAAPQKKGWDRKANAPK
jgi:type VI protein secretion system component Hcp